MVFAITLAWDLEKEYVKINLECDTLQEECY